MIIDLFPPELIALQREIHSGNHPDLMEKLVLAQRESNAGFETQDALAVVAAHCAVMLEGAYSEWDLIGLCGALTEKLREKAAIHVKTH